MLGSNIYDLLELITIRACRKYSSGIAILCVADHRYTVTDVRKDAHCQASVVFVCVWVHNF